MKTLVALLLAATVVSCAAPTPPPAAEVEVFDPAVACRVGHNGGPVIVDRGIGGTGAASKGRIAERGIGGTGIVGIVTGFASICVDGVEVRFDKTVPVSIDGTTATTGQLLVGQLVVVRAGSAVTAPGPFVQARTISVRYEVSGPVEAVDDSAGTFTIAGQRVAVIPTTWTVARPEMGSWIAVSGLRRPDGTILASRLDRARIGVFAVHGQISRERDITRVGDLVLRDPALSTIKAGTFVTVVGKYRNGLADVTSVDEDLLLQDPARYFGITTDRLVLQSFVRVERGTVSLDNGQSFKIGPEAPGNASVYRDAIVWLQRSGDGVFTATDLHYTNYRAQPAEGPTRSRSGRGSSERAPPPPELSPGPSSDNPPGDTIGGEGAIGDTAPQSGDIPTSKAGPSQAEPVTEKAFIAHEAPVAPPSVILSIKAGTEK